MVGVGGIVSVGGAGGGSGGGSTSGITSINGATGPAITLTQSGIINIIRSGNDFSIGAQQSGILGVNGIGISQVGGNFIVDGAAISGLITAHDGSGINAINGLLGPNIDLLGVSGIRIIPSGSSVIISGEGVQGSGGGSDGSGINAINGDTGPNIDFKGVNGIAITNPSAGCIVVDGASISGLVSGSQYSATFTNITSGCFEHNLGSRDLVVQVRDNSGPPRLILPDAIIYDTFDKISVLFNRPQTGRVTIIGSGLACSTSSNQVIEARRYALLVC